MHATIATFRAGRAGTFVLENARAYLELASSRASMSLTVWLLLPLRIRACLSVGRRVRLLRLDRVC
jgi:hypothetical protein